MWRERIICELQLRAPNLHEIAWRIRGSIILLVRLAFFYKHFYRHEMAARVFWWELTKALMNMLYNEWTNSMVNLEWWLFDCRRFQRSDWIKDMNKTNIWDDFRSLTEYVAGKVDRIVESIKFAQSVLLQCFIGQFECKKWKHSITVKPGQVLMQYQR